MHYRWWAPTGWLTSFVGWKYLQSLLGKQYDRRSLQLPCVILHHRTTYENHMCINSRKQLYVGMYSNRKKFHSIQWQLTFFQNLNLMQHADCISMPRITVTVRFRRIDHEYCWVCQGKRKSLVKASTFNSTPFFVTIYAHHTALQLLWYTPIQSFECDLQGTLWSDRLLGSSWDAATSFHWKTIGWLLCFWSLEMVNWSCSWKYMKIKRSAAFFCSWR